MHLLSLNLQRSTAINFAIYGNFCGPKSQDIVVARGNALELLRPDDTGKLISICTSPVFAVIRSLIPFRLAGANRDFLVVGSDSGKISVLEFDVPSSSWKVLHCETFGKTGCRRIVPGQYLAADPKGRAIMIAAVEKQRFVYVMNRDSANRLTMSSPLEAHKAETILFSICGVDVGFDNPIFAMIELEYTESDRDPSGEAAREAEKKLTFYELDLGLNHVVRKWSEPISRTANFLLTVPGGDDGPSGVLICGENWISYKNQGHIEIRTALPRRMDMPAERGLLITTGTLHRQKDMFFFMLQSELGDLYKVTLEVDPNDRKIVTNLIATVFDSIPTANNLCITKTGLLFAASEFANHSLYQFQGIGDDPSAIRAERVDDDINEELGDDSFSAAQVAPVFQASSKMKNLLVTDDITSLAPITDVLIDDMTLSGEDSLQIHALCGRGNRSNLRVLRHGASVTEMAVSDLPGRPMAVWSVRTSMDSEFDEYIVVSFNNATLVLQVSDTIEVATDSGFLTTAPTQQVVLLADNALLQVHNYGIRHIRPDKRTNEWKTPGRRPIERAAVNARQVALSLDGGDIIYFELDPTGQLLEMGTVNMDKEICSLDLGLVPEGRVRSSFLAVGCWDDTVQLLSLDPSDILSQRAAMSVPSRPESVCLVQMMNDRGSGSSSSSSASASTSVSTSSTLYLNVGLANGVLIRVAVDAVAGSFSDSRQRFLGSKAIKLARVSVRGQQGIVALTSRPWLMYNYQGRYFQTPISYEMLEHVSSFTSQVCAEGIVAVAGNTLRIITVDNLGEMFNQVSHPLRYTPRRMQKIPGTKTIAIIETDHNMYNEAEQQQIAAEVAQTFADQLNSEKAAMDTSNNGGDEEEEDEEGTRVIIRGPLPPAEGKWASCIRVMEPSTGVVKDILELQGNEAAMSLCVCKFAQHSEENFVVVGTSKNLSIHTRQTSGNSIHVYRLIDGKLQHLHETEVEDIPTYMCEFQGKLIVGLGRCLRLFELGKRKLLRKCENRLFPTNIVRIHCVPGSDRIYVGDVSESVHFVKYKRQENALVIFADDSQPRYITSLCALDYDTVGCGDKFGNVFVLRLPDHTNDEIDNPSGSRGLWDNGLLNGAPNKVQQLCQFHLGEAITSVTKCSFIPGGEEVMVAATITGGLYAMKPLRSKEDVSFFQHLEMFMRQEYLNLCQRDHLSYRSYFNPVKDTIDGDLCERYGSLSFAKQKELADDIDRTPVEILKKLEDTRNIL